MDRRHSGGSDNFSENLARDNEPDAYSRLGGNFDWRRHYQSAGVFMSQTAGQSIEPARSGGRADADIGAANISRWRPNRNALSCFRLAGFSGVLPRPQGTDYSLHNSDNRPFRSRSMVAAVGLWSAYFQLLTMD